MLITRFSMFQNSPGNKYAKKKRRCLIRYPTCSHATLMWGGGGGGCSGSAPPNVVKFSGAQFVVECQCTLILNLLHGKQISNFGKRLLPV